MTHSFYPTINCFSLTSLTGWHQTHVTYGPPRCNLPLWVFLPPENINYVIATYLHMRQCRYYPANNCTIFTEYIYFELHVGYHRTERP